MLRVGGRIFVDNFNLCTEEGWTVFDRQRQFHPQQRPSAISKSSTPQELETYLRKAGFQDIRIRENATWVQAYAVKPENGNTEGGLMLLIAAPSGRGRYAVFAHEQELKRLPRLSPTRTRIFSGSRGCWNESRTAD